MNPFVLPPAIDKKYSRLDSPALVRQLVLEKENSQFKLGSLLLKIDLISYPAHEIEVG